MTAPLTFGIRKVARPAGESDEYGIRPVNGGFAAVHCGTVRIFATLKTATRYLQRQGYDAFGYRL